MPHYTVFRDQAGNNTLTIQAPDWTVRILNYGTEDAVVEVEGVEGQAQGAFARSLAVFAPATSFLTPDTVSRALYDIFNNN